MKQRADTNFPKWRGAVISLTVALALLGWFFRPTPSLYTVIDLGTLPGNPSMEASAINNQGEIVVTCQSWTAGFPQWSSFVWQGGVMTKLHQPSQPDVSVSAINDKGQITGFGGGPHLDNQAFIFSAGRTRRLPILPGYAGSFGNGINSRGQVVGAMYVSNSQTAGSPQRAFLESGGRMTLLRLLPGKPESVANGINAAGQVVGDCKQGYSVSQAFLYDSVTGKMTALPTQAGDTNSHAHGINDKGDVIGEVDGSQSGGHAALWQASKVKDLGTLPGTNMSIGIALNNQGQAVGNSFSFADSGLSRLFMYLQHFGVARRTAHSRTQQTAWVYREGKMVDLNTLLPARCGWILEEARGINDRGQIVGHGLHHGQERAFLLTPMR